MSTPHQSIPDARQQEGYVGYNREYAALVIVILLVLAVSLCATAYRYLVAQDFEVLYEAGTLDGELTAIKPGAHS